MANIHTPTEVVIGVFYQRSKDPLDVVYSVGGGPNKIHGYDVRGKSFETTPEQVLKWTQLRVNDFPQSPDPRLPYAYDLHWDVKRISQLRHMDAGDRDSVEDMLVRDFGVKKPFSNLAGLANVVREINDVANGYIENPLKAKVPKSLSDNGPRQ